MYNNIMTIIFILQSSIADKTIVLDLDNGRRRNRIGAINPMRDNRLYYIYYESRAVCEQRVRTFSLSSVHDK